MNKELFDKAVLTTRMKPKSIRIAKSVLLDGVKISEAARMEGVTRVTAGNAVKRVRMAALKVQNCPDDWVTITVTVPADVAWKISEIELGSRKRICRTKAAARMGAEVSEVAAHEFIVELYGGTQFLAPWSGDPGRTCVRDSAKRYRSEHAATCALAYAKRNYPSRDYSEAKVVSA